MKKYIKPSVDIMDVVLPASFVAMSIHNGLPTEDYGDNSFVKSYWESDSDDDESGIW